ncbi:MAG: hypothetical protein ACFB15_02905 [Cyclobacteriaceae bacterium]
MKEELPTDTPELTPKKRWLDQLPISLEKKFWNSEKIISLSAFVVSIATLLALMYQIRLSGEQNELAQKQQYASVLPYLEIMPQNRNPTHFRIALVNNGIGPAFIDEIRVVYEEQTYVGDPYAFHRNQIMKTDTIYFSYANISEGRVLPVGEEVILIEVDGSLEDKEKLMNWFSQNQEGKELARIEVVYSSVYGARWVTRGIAAIPEPLSTEDAN